MLLAVTVSTRWDDSHGQPIADEHRRIFELLRDGRREESKKLLMSHLAESEEHLLETLGEQATEGEAL
jgi:DNA-binding GntR family transcriptional regulator